MSRSKPVGDDLLHRAAELRAGGAKWVAVAAELGRSVETVSAWPRKHPERWKSAMRAAEQRTLSEACAESVLVLRKQLRSTDEKTAQDAAKSLALLRVNLTKADRPEEAPAPTFTSEGTRLATFLEGQPDEHLARVAANFRADAAARPHDEPEPSDSSVAG